MNVRPTVPRARALALACLIATAPAAARAVGPDRPGAGRGPHVPEFLEMARMILAKGADMGPTDGWFHPAESRYGWDWLSARDGDRDGAVGPDELGGPAEMFGRLDRDGDGAIRADDLDWSPDSAYLRRQAAARRRFAMMDRDSNGRVSRDEWAAYFDVATRGGASLTIEGLARALDAPPPPSPKEGGAPTPAPGPSRWTLLLGLLKGELGSPFEGPGVGVAAPDFTLKTHDGESEVTLSIYRGHRPVVLIFGSFT